MCFVLFGKLTVAAESHLTAQGSLGESPEMGLTMRNRESENPFLLYSGFDVLIFDIILRETETQGEPFVNFFCAESQLTSQLLGQMVWKLCSRTSFQHVKQKQYKHILPSPQLILFFTFFF